MIEKIINFLEKGEFNFTTWLISFLTLISTRLLIESLLLGFPEKNLESFTALFCHTFLFFCLTYLVFLIFLYLITKEKIKKIASFLLWGFLIIIFPPIIDKVIFQGDVYKSFYIFDSFKGLVLRFFTFFGENPDWGITWGTRVNILISIFALNFYVYLKTKNKTKTIITLLGSYLLFFILSCFPSFVVYFIEFFKTGTFLNTTYSTVAGHFMSPFSVFGLKNVAIESFLAKKLALIYLPLIFILLLFFCLKLNFQKSINLIKNIRLPQVIFNEGLLFIGMGLSFFYWDGDFEINFLNLLVVLNLFLVVLLTWVFSVVVNDFCDLEIDRISNKNRPLVTGVVSKEEYKDYGLLILLLSLFGSALISPVIFLVIINYHLLTFFYSTKPFRIRRFLLISNVLISLASLLFMVIGFMVFSENQTLNNFPWAIFWFLFGAYLLITPLKDLKDCKSDKRNKIITLPGVLGKENTRLLIAGLLFSFYLSSVYVLKKQELFPLALLIGGVSFFVVENRNINERKLNYWVLGLVLIYGIGIVSKTF